MGFLENLRRQRATEAEAKKQEFLETQKTAEEIRQAKEKESNRIRQLVDAAKAQFDESGVRPLIDELLKIEYGLKFEEIIDWYDKEDAYKCEVILQDVSPNYYDRAQVKVFIGIDTTHDGAIRFNGDPKNGSSVVSRYAWKNNKDILEAALGKAYKNPQRKTYGPFKNYESAGPGSL